MSTLRLDSKITVDATTIKELILEHLRKTDKHGLTYKDVYFNIYGGGDDGYGGYDSPQAH